MNNARRSNAFTGVLGAAAELSVAAWPSESPFFADPAWETICFGTLKVNSEAEHAVTGEAPGFENAAPVWALGAE